MADSDLEELTALKAAVAAKDREAARAAGAMDQLKHRLKTEFDCSDLDEAKVLLAKLARRERRQKAAYQKMLARFKRRYGKFLGLD